MRLLWRSNIHTHTLTTHSFHNVTQWIIAGKKIIIGIVRQRKEEGERDRAIASDRKSE